MLPDLRLLAIATLSTFVATVCAALFVSSRLLPEPAAFHTDRNPDDAPIGRISGAWPDARQLAPRDLNIAPKPQQMAPAIAAPKMADRPSTDSVPAPDSPPVPPAASSESTPNAAGTSSAVESVPATSNPPAPAAPGESVAVKGGTAPSQPTTASVPQEAPASPGTASETAAPDQTGSIPEKPQNSTPPAAQPTDTPKSASLPPEKPKVEKRKPGPRVVKRRRLIPAPAATANGSATTSTAPARDFFVDFPSSPR